MRGSAARRVDEAAWFYCTDRKRKGGQTIQLSFCPNSCSEAKMRRCKIRKTELAARGV